jgi:hypothetical protein
MHVSQAIPTVLTILFSAGAVVALGSCFVQRPQLDEGPAIPEQAVDGRNADAMAPADAQTGLENTQRRASAPATLVTPQAVDAAKLLRRQERMRERRARR